MEDSSRKRRWIFAFALLLLYPSFTEVLQQYLGTGMLRFLPLLVGAMLCCILLTRESPTRQLLLPVSCIGEVWLWMIIFLLAVYRNYDIRYLENLGGIGIFIVILLLIPFLPCKIDWIDTFYQVLLIFMAIHLSVTILSYIFPPIYNNGIGPALGHYHPGDPGYKYGLWINYGYNALCISIALLLFAAKSMTSKKRHYIVLSILALFALLLTEKRGPLLFSGGAFFVTWVLWMYKSKKKTRKVVFLVVSFLAVYAILVWKFPNTLRVFERFSLESGEDISTGRFDLYQEALALFLEHPLLGIGWSGFRFYHSTIVMGYDNFGAFDVHNIYLQILCETGIVGIVTFLTIAWYSIRNAIYVMLHWSEEMGCSWDAAVSAVGIQLFFLMQGLTSNTLYVPTIFVPYIFSCAGTYAVRLYWKQKAKKCEGIGSERRQVDFSISLNSSVCSRTQREREQQGKNLGTQKRIESKE